MPGKVAIAVVDFLRMYIRKSVCYSISLRVEVREHFDASRLTPCICHHHKQSRKIVRERTRAQSSDKQLPTTPSQCQSDSTPPLQQNQTMWLGALAKVTAVGVATLATSSGINMWQTINSIRTTSTSPEMDGQLLTITGKSSHQIVEELQRMNRQEILSLFLACSSIQLDDLDGEWDGLLLDNNTWIMVRIDMKQSARELLQ